MRKLKVQDVLDPWVDDSAAVPYYERHHKDYILFGNVVWEKGKWSYTIYFVPKGVNFRYIAGGTKDALIPAKAAVTKAMMELVNAGIPLQPKAVDGDTHDS